MLPDLRLVASPEFLPAFRIMVEPLSQFGTWRNLFHPFIDRGRRGFDPILAALPQARTKAIISSSRKSVPLAGERMISNSRMGWPARGYPETVSKMIFTEAEAI